MKKAYIDKILNEVIKEAQDIDIPVSFNVNREIVINSRAKKRMGCCYKRSGGFIIEISEHIINLPEKIIRETIAHEVLHTCDKCFNHGSLWKYYAKQMNAKYGYNIKSVSRYRVVNENINYKYVIECEKCGNKIYRLKKSKLVTDTKKYRCKCGGKLTTKEL